MSGYFKDNVHYCTNGHKSKYQIFSGGREFYCPTCGDNGSYPKIEKPLIRAHLLQFGDEGIKQFRKEMNEELEKRKG